MRTRDVIAASVVIAAIGCRPPAPRGDGADLPIPEAPSERGTDPAPGLSSVPADPAADLYAPFSEAAMPAEGHASLPLRPRKTDSVYRIASPRVERGGPSPFPRLVVDYERTWDGTAGGVLSLVIRPSGKKDEDARVGVLNDRAGKIEVGFRSGFPFARDLPALENCEYYLTLTDQGYGAGFHPTFKVSNSVTLGEVKGGTSPPRAWTADEATRLRKPSPKWPEANRNVGVGSDTPFAGDVSGNPPTFRYAEEGRPLLGLEWNTWAWEGVPCLAHVYPIYERDMPLKGIMPGVRRELAKPGYAIGGLQVKAGKQVHAMRVTYRKLTAGNSLDPADSYSSDWLGNAAVAADVETRLGGNGRHAIGVTLKGGAVLNAISLVMGGAAK